MNRPAQHERVLIARFRGDNAAVSTTDPRETQRAFDRESTMDTRLHDQFCRCRACKPPLVGNSKRYAYAQSVGIIAGAAAGTWAVIVAAWQALYR